MFKKRFYLFLFVFLTSGFWFACTNSSSGNSIPNNSNTGNLNPAPEGFKVSTYIRTWAIPKENQKNGSQFWNANMIKGEYLTELIIAFANIKGTSIFIPYGSSNLWKEVAAVKDKYPNLRVNISIGGWGADGFSDMANSSGTRATFAANVCKWLESYNLDGVDIDWEFPVGPPWGQEIKSSPADRDNYISLLQDLRSTMNTLGGKTNKYYSLSTAVPANPWFVDDNRVLDASKIVDNFKLMSYDYCGSWSTTTEHLSNLYENPKKTGGLNTDQAVNMYLNKGIPSEKIILGIPFYGLAFKGVKNTNNGLFQEFSSVAFDNGSVDWPQIKQFLKKGSGYTRYWDDVAKAPYLYNGDIWISYTDEQQIKLLTQYAKDKKLGGVFSWEYGHDMEAELLKAMFEGAKSTTSP